MKFSLGSAFLLLGCISGSLAFAGDWVTDGTTGCRIWDPKPRPGETASWSGACIDGKADGPGTLKFFEGDKPGTVTICTFAAGKCSGKGESTYANGGRFEGNHKDGYWHGKGILIAANGNRYEGDFVDGNLTGKGVLTVPNGYRYEGDFVNGRKTGMGVLTYPEGNRYEGGFVDGKKSGKGSYAWPDGDRYSGDYIDDKRTGKGVYIWPNGTRYEGDFVDNKLHGYGEKRFKNGDRQRGMWVADNLARPCASNEACADMKAEAAMPIVNCKVNDVDISKEYRGECRNGLAHGKGRAKGRDTYVGEFKDGNAHGQGTYTWASGGSYEGAWVNGERTNGTLKNSSGDYEGDFLKANKHGYGIYKYSCNCSFWSCNTCTNQGWWQNNEFVRSCDSRDACQKIARLEPQIRKAEKEFRCEDAKRINQELEAIKASVFYFDSCVRERRFNELANASDPQDMYIAAGRYESDGERSRAKTLYHKIVDRFPKSPLALKATDRLTRLADVEAVEASNSNAAYQVESANNRSREAAYQQCMNQYSACLSRCNHKSSCTSGCSLCAK